MTAERTAPTPVTWWTSWIALALAALVVVPVLWNLRLDPLRQATESGLYADFFDHQAEAFLDGRLDVPRGALGIEGFIVDGREYLYFAPLPALLRVPLLAATDAWFGRVTALSMLVAWLLFAAMTSVLIWRIRRAITGGRALAPGESWWWGGLIVAVTAGSPVLLLAAVPWVYSEALMWATAGSVAVLAAALGVVERPSAGRIVLLFLATMVAVLSRVTAAWPAATVVTLVAIANARRRPGEAMRGHVAATLAAGLIPLAVGVGFNLAKFGHPVSIPFEHQVWTGVSEHRRDVLAEGGVVGARFLPTTLVAYGRPDALRITSVFPFVSAPSAAPNGVGGQTLDMSYRTPSVPVTMPALVALAMVGLVRVFRRRAPPQESSLRPLLVGAALIPGGVLLVGYIAPRYLVEFLPFLTVAAAAGLAVLLGTRRRGGGAARAAVAALAALGLTVNLAIAVWSADVRHGVEPLRRLIATQMDLAALPGVDAPAVIVGAEPPPRTSAPDTVYLVDQCEAAYYGTGDRYEPWAPIWMPRLRLRLQGGAGPAEPIAVPLVAFGPLGRVVLDLDGEGRYRWRTVGTDGGYRVGSWHDLTGVGSTVTISGVSDWDSYLIEAPGHLYTSAPSLEEFGDDVRRRPVPATVVADAATPRELGVDLDVEIVAPSLCDDLRARASGD